MHLQKIISSIFISLFLIKAAFALGWQETFPFNQSQFLRENINCALVQNSYPKVFSQNLINFENFLSQRNLVGCSYDIQANSKFLPPVFDSKKELTAEPEKTTRTIIACLYFNALKDAKIVDLQKERISIYKELFDLSKEADGLKEIAQTTKDYMNAQVDFLEYQKAEKLCYKQLASFAGKVFEPSSENFDQLEIKNTIEKLLLQNFKDNPAKEGLLYKLRCDYNKYKVVDEKIQKMENLSPKEEYFAELQDKLDLIELKKRQANLKLACLIDYISLIDF